MKKLLAIGEALIDFIPEQVGVRISEVKRFSPKVGGAPANVCGAYVRLGGASSLITMLGADSFGDKIIEELRGFGIDDSAILRTTKACTSLAFVALKEDGNREFSFYRNPGADMLLSEDDVDKRWFSNVYALHFGTVSLGDFPMKRAHDMAIRLAKEKGSVISFDPNIRKPLWKDEHRLYEVVKEYRQKADILKISDEELLFISGTTDIKKAAPQLLNGQTKLIVYTKGNQGAECFTKNTHACVNGIVCNAIDTTGAGDGFIGAFLYKLSKDEVTAEKLEKLTSEKLEEYLDFANRFSAISVQTKGAIASYPDMSIMVKEVGSKF